MSNTIQFAGYSCKLSFARYINGGIAIRLVDAEDHTPIAMATICVTDAQLKEGEVLIKDYSENQGMVDTLTEAGIIEKTGRTVRSGYVDIPVCRLLV